MTAKPAQQNTSQATLVDSLQSEVSAEASPLLLFLIAHARKIALFLVLFIIAIAGYWFYSSQASKLEQQEALALGQIMIVSDPALRLEKLEAFVPNAPGSVQRAAWFAIMEAATMLQMHDKAYTAWKKIADFGPGVKVPAAMGMASALAEQEKFREALDLLNGVALELKGQDLVNVNARISVLAEVVEDYPRALAACDVIIAGVTNPTEMKIWAQKKAELEKKIAR